MKNIISDAFLDLANTDINNKTEKNHELNEENISISSRSTKLFPADFILDTDQTELFRSMCILSQCTLPNSQSIKSHRPVIGTIIVFFKKIAWKLIEPQINKTLSGIQDCFSSLIVSHAKLMVDVKKIQIKHNDNS